MDRLAALDALGQKFKKSEIYLKKSAKRQNKLKKQNFFQKSDNIPDRPHQYLPIQPQIMQINTDNRINSPRWAHSI